MPAFSRRCTIALETLLGDQWAVTGKITEYLVESVKLLNADRANDQMMILSGGLSAQAIPISPLGVSAPPQLVFLCTDLPVDVRINAASDATFLSSVRLWCMAGFVSNLFITTGSAQTTMLLKVAGGSNASIQGTFPLP